MTMIWDLGAFEIDALGDGQAVKGAAQAVEAEFDGTETHPFAAAEDARAAGFGVPLAGDADADRAAEIDAVGAVVEVDQHRQRVARAAVAPCRLGHRASAVAGDLAGARQAQPVPQFARIARHRAAAREEARDDLLLEHAVQLARHPRREEAARLADIHRKAAGAAARVMQDLAAAREPSVPAFVPTHQPAATSDVPGQRRKPLLT